MQEPAVSTQSPAVARMLSGLGLASSPVASLADREPTPLGRAPMADIGMGALVRFKALMSLEGQTVHVARMCYDRQYAFERIANAHSSARDPLRRLALELFQAFHHRDEARRISG